MIADTHITDFNGNILHVTDYHIGARYGALQMGAQTFLNLATKCKTLEDFVVKAQLADSHPLCLLSRHMKEADAIAMTGDMVEFINQLPEDDDDTMIRVGIRFHEMLLNQAGQKPVFEVIGNHERVKAYEKALDRLQHTYHNFQMNADHFKIGHALFIHGDRDLHPYALEGERAYQRRDMERARHPDDQLVEYIGNHNVPRLMQRMPRLHRLLEATLSPWVSNPNPILFSTENQVKLLLHNLGVRLGEDRMKQVEHVFLGHTHIPYREVKASFSKDHCITLHNSGAAIHGKYEECEPLMIAMHDGRVMDVATVKPQVGLQR